MGQVYKFIKVHHFETLSTAGLYGKYFSMWMSLMNKKKKKTQSYAILSQNGNYKVVFDIVRVYFNVGDESYDYFVVKTYI